MGWVLAMATAAALTLAVLRLGASGPPEPLPVCAGWGLALGAAVAARFMNRRAVRPGAAGVLLWGAGGTLLKLTVLAAVIVIAAARMEDGRASFLAAVFSAYAVLLVAEITRLFRAGQDRSQHE